MAATTTVLNTFSGNAGLWFHVFQGANTSWLTFDQRIIVGNFFLGLQGSSFQSWQANIPPRSIITSASMRVRAFATNLVAQTSDIVCPERFANSNNVLPIANPSSYFTGWRRNGWGNANMVLLSTGFTSIASTGAAHNGAWIFRQIVASGTPSGGTPTPGSGHRMRMAQAFTTAASGNTQILTLTSQMLRSAVAPVGNFRVVIRSSTLASDGVTTIPGITLATSSVVSMASFPTTAGNVVFTFPVPERITLAFNTEYFAEFVPDSYVINNVNYVSLRYEDLFLSNGRLMHFGEGWGADWQNAPGVADVHRMANLGDIAPPVPWVMPLFGAGLLYNSPDVSSLIQAQVDAPGYSTSDRSVILGIRGLGGTSSRIYVNNGHASGQPPRLTVTWRRRRVFSHAR